MGPELELPGMKYIHTSVYCGVRRQMAKARVFQSGNSQAVRLPKQFRVSSKEVEIFQRGNELVLRETVRPMVLAFDLLADLPVDFMQDGRQDSPPQTREGLE